MTADIVFYDEAASRESLVTEEKGDVALTTSWNCIKNVADALPVILFFSVVDLVSVVTSSGYSPRSAHQYSPPLYPSK